jgi:hypothetical protein
MTASTSCRPSSDSRSRRRISASSSPVGRIASWSGLAPLGDRLRFMSVPPKRTHCSDTKPVGDFGWTAPVAAGLRASQSPGIRAGKRALFQRRARMGYCTAGRRWHYLASTTCGIRVGGVPCRFTNTVARSAARCSSTPSISLNMKPLIRIARSAEARRFNTYQRHLSRKRPERAEIYLLTIRFLVQVINWGRGFPRFRGDELRPTSCPSKRAKVTSAKSALS